MAELYRVTVWDKQVNEPYYKLTYEDVESAKYVAKQMKQHYIDDWGEHAASIYEVRLQRIQEENNG